MRKPKVIKTVQKGTLNHVTVELEKDLVLVALHRDEKYFVPGVEMVLYAESLLDSQLVTWCEISQKWVQ